MSATIAATATATTTPEPNASQNGVAAGAGLLVWLPESFKEMTGVLRVRPWYAE
eukprot:NODE_6623_length_498_cov_86.866370_g5838_i0.p3 GENE.NODE_6623_length_498_cov_86.866370_g5838_i0~~NODE_6623_length_498_cov_86.866370_g5838_i0.p3  ORF type:complete len:54 (-),score=12.53 NODE_6623_length_498_cov_86.866370_g5838_i0:193-354(-)